ncbi:DUF3953 domain-containing protein [Terribacillus goriensis]|uniref:DUF3953 domain-containing protein n=1 Tax=Terribacillus saccharophilus TaxID=361277 RepID=UPI0039836979
MLKILRIALAFIVVTIAVYSLVTGNHALSPYMLFFLGLMMIVMGISEFKAKRQAEALTCFTVSVFVLFVSVYTF